MSRFTILSALLLTASPALLTGCYSASPGGYFDDHAFYAARQHYRVRYQGGGEAQRAMLPTGWRLINYQYDASGRPSHAFVDRAHMTQLEVDRDLDGRSDAWVYEPESDLLFENESETAEIAVRTLPLQGDAAQRSLAGLSTTIIDALVTSDQTDKFQARRASRLGAYLLEQGPATFGTTEAFGTVVEIQDLDRPEGTLDRTVAIVSLVLARPSATWSISGTRGGPDDLPMVVVFLCVARPDVFATERVAFEQLLDRTDFH